MGCSNGGLHPEAQGRIVCGKKQGYFNRLVDRENTNRYTVKACSLNILAITAFRGERGDVGEHGEHGGHGEHGENGETQNLYR
ncbi:hypothetical protein ACN38_g3143 [Penicillium nordicum]|uniref:Uncharacterized protein n=1 Tax=Penicillium nordicum TaxID=229535 RepID=A0A0M9WIA4_9EURO|nr:hypothetical protein ACN38_g3143 [Penicillium nordicum]